MRSVWILSLGQDMKRRFYFEIIVTVFKLSRPPSSSSLSQTPDTEHLKFLLVSSTDSTHVGRTSN